MTAHERLRRSAATALFASGVLLMLVGGTWWAFDANPTLGRVLVAIGAVVVGAGLFLPSRLGTTGRRLVLAFGALVFIVAVFEVWQAIATIIDQRRATPA